MTRISRAEEFRWAIVNGERLPYIVSSYGYVISVFADRDPHLLKRIFHKQHMYVRMTVRGKSKNIQVHRVVAESFLNNPENKPIVHHINKNPIDNRVENLIWCTQIEHKRYHADEIARNRKVFYGDSCNFSVYSNEQIHSVCKLLETNSMSITDIVSMTGVKRATISKIMTRHQWTVVSELYNIDNYDYDKWKSKAGDPGNRNSPYTVDQIRYVCTLINEYYRISDIVRMTGVGRRTISYIKHGKIWTHISSEYGITDKK